MGKITGQKAARRIEDDEIEAKDLRTEEAFQAAKAEVNEYVQRVREVTIGGLGRQFPQHQPIMMLILADLKLDNELDYDDNTPPPTWVKVMALVAIEKIRQVERVREKYNVAPKTGKRGWASRPIVKAPPRPALNKLVGRSNMTS